MELLEGRIVIDDLDAFLTDLDEIGTRYGVTIQVFDARYVAGRRHLERAVSLADRAIDRGTTVARDRGVEILCYAAGRRQINRAMEMGVSEGPNDSVVILVDAETNDGDEAGALEALRTEIEPASTLDTIDEERLRAFFEITDDELSATDAEIEALVCERVALLEVTK